MTLMFILKILVTQLALFDYIIYSYIREIIYNHTIRCHPDDDDGFHFESPKVSSSSGSFSLSPLSLAC